MKYLLQGSSIQIQKLFFSRTSLNFHQPSHGQAKSRLSENLQHKQELRLLSTVTLSDNKDCLEFRFSIVRIAIRVSNVTSLQN